MPLIQWIMQNLSGVPVAINGTSSLDSAANKIHPATANLSATTTVIAEAELTSIGQYATVLIAAEASINVDASYTTQATCDISPHATLSAFASKDERPTVVEQPNYSADLPGTFAVFGWEVPSVALTFIYGRDIFSEVKKKRRDIIIKMKSHSLDRKKQPLYIRNIEIIEGIEPALITFNGFQREDVQPKVGKHGQIVLV